MPPGYNPQLPGLIVLYLHGQGATLERDVQARQAIPRQIAASDQNVALVAPQLAYDAPDLSAGNFWKPGHFAAYLDEAAERLMRLYGDKRAGTHFNTSGVVIVSYSGGYVSTACALANGGAVHRIKGVILMDLLYGDEEKFAAWAAARRKLAFLLSAFTELTREENATLQSLLGKRRISYASGLPTTLTPGTNAFVPCGGWEMHGDFMTRAWGPDPFETGADGRRARAARRRLARQALRPRGQRAGAPACRRQALSLHHQVRLFRQARARFGAHLLELQGGLMSPDELEAFRAHPQHAEAVRVRRFDEAAKDPRATTPDFDYYLRHVEACQLK